MKKSVKIISIAFAVIVSAVLNPEADIREVWSRSYPLEGNYSEIGSDIKVDSIKKNLYVTGLRCVKEGEKIREIVTVRKIDLEGKELWKQVSDIGVGGLDENSIIAVDKKNNVYVAGYRYIENKGKNLWFRKYDSSGIILWDKTYENLDSRDAEFKDIDVNAEDNIYTVGYKYTDEFKRDLWIRKYDPDGKELWKDNYSRSDNTTEEEQGLAIDPDGNACVAVYEDGANAEYFLTIKKYDGNGKVLMSKQYQEKKEKACSVSKIAVDSAKNIYIAGSESVFYQGRNIIVRKFDAKGLSLWVKTYTNTGYQHYTGNNIMIDKDMNLYVSATGGGGKDDKKYSWISGLDREGNELWQKNYSGYSYGVKFTVRQDGTFYVLGTETDKSNNSNIWVKSIYKIRKNKEF